MSNKITFDWGLNPIQAKSFMVRPLLSTGGNNFSSNWSAFPSSTSANVSVGIRNRSTLPAVAAILGSRFVTCGGLAGLYIQQQ